MVTCQLRYLLLLNRLQLSVLIFVMDELLCLGHGFPHEVALAWGLQNHAPFALSLLHLVVNFVDVFPCLL